VQHYKKQNRLWQATFLLTEQIFSIYYYPVKNLTEKQEKILDYISKFVEDNGYPPTLREIGQHFGIASTNGVNDHLLAIEKKGYIRRGKDKSRAIDVLTLSDNSTRSNIRAIPVVGDIAAGTPITAQENIEKYLNVDQELFSKKDTFAVKIKGSSMIGDGIIDGDYAILISDRVPNQQDIYAVLIDDEVTLKRVEKNSDGLKLLPSNPDMQPILINADEGKNVSVIGKMVGLVRVK